MNRELRRLFAVLAALFIAVIGIATYWLWRAPDLEAREGNPTELVQQVTIKRGAIFASDGATVIARNRKRAVDGQTWFVRQYPQGPLAAHAVGYSTIERARTGLEQSMNDSLTGSNSDFATLFEQARTRLEGEVRQGNHLVLSLDAEAQATANRLLEGRCGSIVAVEPATGRILAMASAPSFDPNLVSNDFERITQSRGPCDPAAPLVNRATQGLFIPGSIFKLVTAAAALDSGALRPSARFVDRGFCTQYGDRVYNYSDQNGPEVFGDVSFEEAMAHSINAVFCDIGKELGGNVLLDYARRFGFYERPRVELPNSEKVPSGLYEDGELFEPDLASDVDAARLAFGQERLLATPLQMAMVTASIANGGVVMEPHLVDKVLKPDRSTLTETSPRSLGAAIKPGTASTLTAMMESVVEIGTGRAAQIPGVRVAGKTGTAETGDDAQNDAWFVGFAPVGNPQVAVAVALSDEPGTGGGAAAPIARELIETLLGSSA